MFFALQEIEPIVHTHAAFGGKLENLNSRADLPNVAQCRFAIVSQASARSILVTTAASALLNIVGYFKGLSSPSVTDSVRL